MSSAPIPDVPPELPADGVGTPVARRREFCAQATVRRVAAMLDLDLGEAAELKLLPRGWQFVLLAADTARTALRNDGFPGLGVSLPDLGLPRLMLGAREVSFFQDIPVDQTIWRHSQVVSIDRKEGSSGPMAVVRRGSACRCSMVMAKCTSIGRRAKVSASLPGISQESKP